MCWGCFAFVWISIISGMKSAPAVVQNNMLLTFLFVSKREVGELPMVCVPFLEGRWGWGQNKTVLGGADRILWLWDRSHLSGILKVWVVQPSWKGGNHLAHVSCVRTDSAKRPTYQGWLRKTCCVLLQKACIPSAGWVLLGHSRVEKALKVLPRLQFHISSAGAW